MDNALKQVVKDNEIKNKENLRNFRFIENYIYLHHTNTLVVLPIWPETIQDQSSATFSSASPLSRSAPIFSYSGSGPRSVQFSFELHRDMMNHVNHNVSNLINETNDDYVDTMSKVLQACAVPKYSNESKMVDPPFVSVRLGNQFFIKGVINGAVGVEHKLPLLDNDKYAIVTISFVVSECDPYDATDVMSMGSFRGLNYSLDRNMWKSNISAQSPIVIQNGISKMV